MNSIEKLLMIGDMRTTGKSEEVVELVLSNPQLFKDVINAILVDDPGIRMRASDVAEKITRTHPEWLQPYKKLFLEVISTIDQKEVRWHTAQMLNRMQYTKIERQKVFDLLITFLKDRSSIVKTFTMQALADMAIQNRNYLNQVQRLLYKLTKEGSPAMQARGKKLLLALKKVAT